MDTIHYILTWFLLNATILFEIGVVVVKKKFLFCTSMCFLWNREVGLPFKSASRIVHYWNRCCTEEEMRLDVQAAVFRKGFWSTCICFHFFGRKTEGIKTVLAPYAIKLPLFLSADSIFCNIHPDADHHAKKTIRLLFLGAKCTIASCILCGSYCALSCTKTAKCSQKYACF